MAAPVLSVVQDMFSFIQRFYFSSVLGLLHSLLHGSAEYFFLASPH